MSPRMLSNPSTVDAKKPANVDAETLGIELSSELALGLRDEQVTYYRKTRRLTLASCAVRGAAHEPKLE